MITGSQPGLITVCIGNEYKPLASQGGRMCLAEVGMSWGSVRQMLPSLWLLLSCFHAVQSWASSQTCFPGHATHGGNHGEEIPMDEEYGCRVSEAATAAVLAVRHRTKAGTREAPSICKRTQVSSKKWLMRKAPKSGTAW